MFQRRVTLLVLAGLLSLDERGTGDESLVRRQPSDIGFATE